ncbi:conserved exported hypothetical protein [Methylocella tundrae]|uniref:HTH DNA binding domain-containing protein n=2 Tax=Methylocella tundrae TaxID=227605 RepID=A0A8B6M787_METTU|nr:conserved exported hypothetical protein [Methylocella tundrae]VTZ50696.1 conserved exported hypothetical protein [Methylocella tundrae]
MVPCLCLFSMLILLMFYAFPQSPAKSAQAGPGRTSRAAVAAADLASLLVPLSAADDALARLDERLRASPVRDGWIARADFTESCAALWAEGELVHLEDLVLNDAGMDARSPSHALTRACAYLNLRRKAFALDPRTQLSPTTLLRLAGRAAPAPSAEMPEDDESDTVTADDRDDRQDADLAAALAGLTAATKAAAGALERAGATPLALSKDAFVYDEQWDEAGRLAAWRHGVADIDDLPPLLGALTLAHSWRELEPIQRQGWLAPLLAALHLRRRGRAKAHLLCLHLGLRALRPKPGSAKTMRARLHQGLAIVEAAAREGLAQHDRLMLARQLLERKCKGRRASSNMPRLAELLISRPVATVPLIARELGVSQQAAQGLVAEIGPGLREITGRKRYRAWAVG